MDHGEINKLEISRSWLIRSGSIIDTTVYRKPSASDRYLHYTSAQAWHEKTAAIHTLTLRALNYCSNKELLTQELAHITKVFLDNGFPLEAIQRIINMKSHPKEASETQWLDESHDEQSITKAFYAPYHPHARKMFEVLQKKFGITNVYKKDNHTW